MGSLVVSTIAALGRETFYSGYILCGSPSPNAMAPVGMALARSFCALGLSQKPNLFLHALVFADASKLFRHEKRHNSWISSDEAQVGRYNKDPLCGFHFTTAGFYDLFDGLSRVRSSKWAVRTECKPFLVISGDKDPIGSCGGAVRWIDDQLEAAGRQVEYKLYPGKRHEILNEADCDQVYVDILKWILEVYNCG